MTSYASPSEPSGLRRAKPSVWYCFAIFGGIGRYRASDYKILRFLFRPGITGPATLKYRLGDEMISEYVAARQATGDTRGMQEIVVE